MKLYGFWRSTATWRVRIAFAHKGLEYVPQLRFALRFQVDLAPVPTLRAIDAACAALPAFVRAHADNQPDAGTV